MGSADALDADALDHALVVQWAERSVDLLTAAQRELNAANVFPVADSDTGTNMLLTLRQGVRALKEEPEPGSGAAAMRVFARGALVGARGNSGIILSEYLRGFALALSEPDHGASGMFARCLTRAAESATAAVAEPVAGTMLTAADRAAHAARTADADDGRVSAGAVLASACAAARQSLERSPAELQVLADNGVVDSGAHGLTLVLEALAACWSGSTVSFGGTARVASGMEKDSTEGRRDIHKARDPEHPAQQGWESQSHHQHGPGEHSDGEFEVMYLVDHPGDPRSALLERLRQIGSSVVVVGGEGVWQVHVHTDDPPAALRSVPGGRMRQVCVRHLIAPDRDAPAVRAPGIVVGTSSPGLVADMARAGAVVLMRGEAPWDVAEVQRAVIDAGTDRVVVLAPTTADANAAYAVRPGFAQPALRPGSAGPVPAEPTGAPGTEVDEPEVSPDVVVLETATELHAVVALTAAAELLDAAPRQPAGEPVPEHDVARDTQDVVEAMTSAMAALGDVVRVGSGGSVDDVATRLSGLDAGSLGLALVLHPQDATDDDLARMRQAVAARLGTVDCVLLNSGRDAEHILVGAL